MAILSSVGCDLVKVSRIEQLLKKYGMRALKKISPHVMINLNDGILRISSIWAAREATYKAWSILEPSQAQWRLIQIHHNGIHPIVKFVGDGEDLKRRAQVSVSHDGEYTIAVCLLQVEKIVS